jgi:hypothetical protein
MKNFLLSLAAVSLCVAPALAADASSTSVPCAAPAQSLLTGPPAPAPSDPNVTVVKELPNPAPIDLGLMGPCHITVNCSCSCGIVPVSCSGQTHCVGGGGVMCDNGPFMSCTAACLTCNE